MRDPDDDIVQWILRRVVDQTPGYAASGSNAALEVEQIARITWGGKRPYIAKQSPAMASIAPRRREKRRG